MWVARLETAAKDRLMRHRQRTSAAVGKLDALSPLGVLARGYALVQQEGRVVQSATQVLPGETVDVRLSNGELSCEVKEVTWRRLPGSRPVSIEKNEPEESFRFSARVERQKETDGRGVG